jgi:hypothetical protein
VASMRCEVICHLLRSVTQGRSALRLETGLGRPVVLCKKIDHCAALG